MNYQYVVGRRPNGTQTILIQDDPYNNGWNSYGYGYQGYGLGGYGFGRVGLWGNRYVYNNQRTIIIKKP